MRDKTVCFSGHRPEKLPGAGKDDNIETRFIKELLNKKIEECISEGYVRFMSGVARGIDLWAAEIIISHRQTKPDIRLICVKPVSDQGKSFPEDDKLLYNHIINCADSVVCTSETYKRSCYTIRNRYMVDNSDKLIAFVKSYRSGTGQTINYAKKLGRCMDVVDLSDINFSLNYEQLAF